jgi:amino acid transporter
MAHPISEASAGTKALRRQLRLRDLVLSQVLLVVGSSWVGVAGILGRAYAVTWVLAMLLFYVPSALSVIQLNRIMPLEGGLYSWARIAFGELAGFLVAWNVWIYGTIIVIQILYAIPTELFYLIGPAAAWIPESHFASIAITATLLLLVSSAAVRGLNLAKWIHAVGSIAILTVFAVLIALPFWGLLHHVPMHWEPVPLSLPHQDLASLAVFGQMIFGALCGIEYIAILAGEAEDPAKAIGRSVTIASPIICLMFIMGTGAVLAFSSGHIDLIAPIPQTLRLALGSKGLGQWFAVAIILLLQLRIIGAASLLFTGITRLPMTAGWYHLVPVWLSRLHPRYATPRNAIFFTAGAILILLIIFSMGVHAQEAFQVFGNASIVHYQLAYLAMFAIPMVGAVAAKNALPRWLRWTSLVGFCATLFSFVLAAYPIVEVSDRRVYATKIIGTVCLSNVVGYCFYRWQTSRFRGDEADAV